jgi:hypothetical protein
LGHEQQPPLRGQALFAAALVEARLAAAGTGVARPPLNSEHAHRAVDLLDQAADGGWQDLKALDENPSFGPFRSRPDFQAVREKITRKR